MARLRSVLYLKCFSLSLADNNYFKRKLNNLVPRISSLHVPGRKRRDLGNEVENLNTFGTVK